MQTTPPRDGFSLHTAPWCELVVAGHTHTPTHTHQHRHTDTLTHTVTHTHTHTHSHRHTYTQIYTITIHHTATHNLSQRDSKQMLNNNGMSAYLYVVNKYFISSCNF